MRGDGGEVRGHLTSSTPAHPRWPRGILRFWSPGRIKSDATGRPNGSDQEQTFAQGPTGGQIGWPPRFAQRLVPTARHHRMQVQRSLHIVVGQEPPVAGSDVLPRAGDNEIPVGSRDVVGSPHDGHVTEGENHVTQLGAAARPPGPLRPGFFLGAVGATRPNPAGTGDESPNSPSNPVRPRPRRRRLRRLRSGTGHHVGKRRTRRPPVAARHRGHLVRTGARHRVGRWVGQRIDPIDGHSRASVRVGARRRLIGGRPIGANRRSRAVRRYFGHDDLCFDVPLLRRPLLRRRGRTVGPRPTRRARHHGARKCGASGNGLSVGHRTPPWFRVPLDVGPSPLLPIRPGFLAGRHLAASPGQNQRPFRGQPRETGSDGRRCPSGHDTIWPPCTDARPTAPCAVGRRGRGRRRLECSEKIRGGHGDPGDHPRHRMPARRRLVAAGAARNRCRGRATGPNHESWPEPECSGGKLVVLAVGQPRPSGRTDEPITWASIAACCRATNRARGATGAILGVAARILSVHPDRLATTRSGRHRRR